MLDDYVIEPDLRNSHFRSNRKFRVKINSIKFNLSLTLHPRELFVWDWASFSNYLFNEGVFVTGRDMPDADNLRNDTYSRSCLKVDKTKQYSEPGCGIGGFLEYLTDRQTPFSPKPFAIDPFNPYVCKDLLVFARDNLDFGGEFREKLNGLIRRIDILLDPSKVVFLNMTLGEALVKHPEIKGIADVVVDNFALEFHYHNMGQLNGKYVESNVLGLVRELYKPELRHQI